MGLGAFAAGLILYGDACGCGQRGAISSAGERFVHTEEVTGSIPVSPTLFSQVRGQITVMLIWLFDRLLVSR